jgi:mannan endo-1,4-beta-mannosidase
MKEWAIEVNEREGINTYGWHALNFTSGGSSWDKTSCVADILPDGKYHYDFLRKLDLVAGFFKDLVNADGQLIPVIFRPWHEMNGSWFWWGEGNCTAEDYKQLWRFTYDYLSDNHKLNNIIWCYSTDAVKTEAEYLKYYPGDEYVDILGFDDYQGVSNSNRFAETIQRFEIVNKLAAEKGKVYALSETGSERIENPKWFTEVLNGVLLQNESTLGAAYVLFWRNGRPDHFYASYPEHSSAPDFVEFSNHASTIFLNDISSIKE